MTLIRLTFLICLFSSSLFSQNNLLNSYTSIGETQIRINRAKSEYEAIEALVEPFREDTSLIVKKPKEYLRAVREYRFAANRTNPYNLNSESENFLNQTLSAMISSNIEEPSDLTSWESIGPYGENNSGIKTVQLGRVESSAYDPFTGDYYIGANNGGLWKSTDNGNNWQNITDHLRLPSLGITDIRLTDIPGEIFISTGVELGNPVVNDRQFSYGIFRSTDYGQTWQNIYSSAELNYGYIKKMLLRTNSLGETDVYFILNSYPKINSIFKRNSKLIKLTRNDNWNETVLFNSEDGDITNPKLQGDGKQLLLDFEFLPIDNKQIFLTTVSHPYNVSGDTRAFIYNNENWYCQNIEAPNPNWQRIDLPNVPRGSFAEDDYNQLKSLQTLVEISPDKPGSFFIAMAEFRNQIPAFTANYFYEFKPSTSIINLLGKSNEETFENQHRAEYFVSKENWTVFGVSSLKNKTLFKFNEQIHDIELISIEELLHVDPRNHAIFQKNEGGELNEYLLIGQDGGLEEIGPITTNGNVNTLNTKNLNGKNLTLTQFYGFDFIYNKSNTRLISGGTQDNRGFNQKSRQQEFVYEGDVGGDQYDVSMYYDENENLVQIFNTQSQINHTAPLESFNGALRTNSFDPVIGGGGIPYNPHDASREYKNVLVTKKNNFTYYEFNGNTKKLSRNIFIPQHPNSNIEPKEKKLPLAIEADPFNKNQFYVAYAWPKFVTDDPLNLETATERFRILRMKISDDGRYKVDRDLDHMCTEMEVTNRPENLFAEYNVADIAPSRNQNGDLYIGCGAYTPNDNPRKVYKISFGEFCDQPTITDISYNLPTIPVVTLECRNNNGIDELYVGNDMGIFYWNENLDMWINISKQLPLITIQDIEIDEKANELLVATFGRGIYKAPLFQKESDLWVKRTSQDKGNSPLDQEVLWTSPAIKVTATRESDEDLVEIPLLQNFIKVTVKNRGEFPSRIGDKVNVYFSKASTGLRWPNDWASERTETGTDGNEYKISGLIESVTINKSILPDEEYEIIIPWTPPRADLLSSDDPGHFCLLARIEDEKGFEQAETEKLWHNVNNNNNLAWRNVIVSTKPDLVVDWPTVRVENTTNQQEKIKTEIVIRGNNASDILNHFDIYFQINDEFYSDWHRSGANKTGCIEKNIFAIDQFRDLGIPPISVNLGLINAFQLNKVRASLDNINIAAETSHYIALQLQVKPNLVSVQEFINSINDEIAIDVIQRNELNNDIIGGERFYFKTLPNNASFSIFGAKENRNNQEFSETSIERNDNIKEKTILYPNPCRGEFKLLNYKNDLNYKFYDLAGNLILTLDDYDGNSINFQNNSKGIYVMKAFNKLGHKEESIIFEIIK